MEQLNEWLTVDKTSGEGNSIITLYANETTSLFDKIYNLRIKGVSRNAIVKVKQEAFNLEFMLNSYTIETQGEGGVFPNGVTSNIPWVAEVSDSWISMDVKSGQDGYTPFNITLDEYDYERKGEVVFKTVEGFFLATLYIQQLGDVLEGEFWVECLDPYSGVAYGIYDELLYSTDGKNWLNCPYEGFHFYTDKKVYFRNTNEYWGEDSLAKNFYLTGGRFNIGGDLTALGKIRPNYSGYSEMFINSNIVDASKLILPNVNMDRAFNSMFEGCNLLVNPPKLPATEVAIGYKYMFKGCTSLVKAPQLPATEVINSGYYGMFEGCTSLVEAPELPATKVSGYSYAFMFKDCTSLVTAPELPATDVWNTGTYQSMFEGCTSLVNAPKLPAIFNTNYSSQYQAMFKDCTSLVEAPELLSPSLPPYCYRSMFKGCSSLRYIKMLATDVSEYGCLDGWVNGVSPTGVFVKADSVELPINVNGIPNGWSVYNASDTNIPLPPSELNQKYFWLELEEDGEITGLTDYSKYSIDGLDWAVCSSPLSVEGNRRIYIKSTVFSSNDQTIGFNVNGKIGGDLSSFRRGNCDELFKGNTYLTDASELILPWEDLSLSSGRSFTSMFEGCTSLVNGPFVLPATILGSYCYQYMFKGCTSLVNAPELPATTLASNCYYGMFRGCTSLVTAPELPATTLVSSCYGSMFYDCTNLSYIKMLAIDINSNMRFWVNNVSPNGIFVKHPNANIPIGADGIPEGWTVETATE